MQFTPVLGDIESISSPDAIDAAIARYTPNNANEEDRNAVLYACRFVGEYSESRPTQEAYRKELEKLLQWRAALKNIAVTQFTESDIVEYLTFCKAPPKSWQTQKSERRFIDGHPNRKWRPFSQSRGHTPSADTRQQAIAIISSYYDYLGTKNGRANPVKQIRQRRRFAPRTVRSAIRRITDDQATAVMAYLDADERRGIGKYERARWTFTLGIEQYLRVSEFIDCGSVPPTMGNIYRDGGAWWIRVVGKGNKEREVPLSDRTVEAMIRYRKFLGLTKYPSPNDPTPLIPKLRGKALEPLVSVRQLRDSFNDIFREVYEVLKDQGKEEFATELLTATPHWLRHTGISIDVTRRPKEHVRDDAGHGSFRTTERYIGSDRKERSNSKRAN